MVCSYANTSIFFGIVLLGLTFLSLPIPQLRVIIRDVKISGGAGVVLIALGVILGSFGICG